MHCRVEVKRHSQPEDECQTDVNRYDAKQEQHQRGYNSEWRVENRRNVLLDSGGFGLFQYWWCKGFRNFCRKAIPSQLVADETGNNQNSQAEHYEIYFDAK